MRPPRLLGRASLKNQFWTAPNQLTCCASFSFLSSSSMFSMATGMGAGPADRGRTERRPRGLLARALNQRTMLGQYLDPIADKMLLSSLFLVLSFVKKIPWKYTVLVFSRDVLSS